MNSKLPFLYILVLTIITFHEEQHIIRIGTKKFDLANNLFNVILL